jgi:RNA polymerase sigma factor (sigma-70 family)
MPTKEEATPEIAPALIVRVHRVAFAWAKSRMSRDEADDVAADVTANMLRNGDRVDLAALNESGELDRYVATAARNTFRSQYRSAKRRASYEGACAAEPRLREPYGMSPDDRCDYNELVRAVDAALARIWLPRRRVFLAVTELGMTYKEAAAEFRIPAREVEWITRCARKTMREHLADYRAAAIATRDKGSRGVQ